MKKIITSIIGLSVMFPLMVSAASFVVIPNKTSYKVGENIILNISVNPEGKAIYTAMLDSTFTADTLEIVSFSLNDSMLPLKQVGYDTQDNSNGIFIKTGGYAGGINSNTNFGTLVLRAKKVGVGNLTVLDNSKLLSSINTDLQSGSQILSFNIEKYVPVIVKPKVLSASTSTIATTTETSLFTETNIVILIILAVCFILGFLLGRKKK